jgi:hypothetical protein
MNIAARVSGLLVSRATDSQTDQKGDRDFI